MQRGRRPATYDDILALPEDVRAELVAGEVVVSPAPLPRHARVQRVLGGVLGGPFDDDDGRGGPGGWWIFPEVDVRLGEHVVRPDLAGWRRERLYAPDVRPIEIVPDWICEILSPSNVSYDRVIKRRIYSEYGVRHFWLVDPDSRTLEALVLEAGRWVDAGSFDETASARISPFESVEIDMSRLFLPKSG
jgi:Uma2 family endonuclease